MDFKYKYKYPKTKNNNLILILLLFIFIILNSTQNNTKKFHKLIKLTSGKFFTIFDSGIYLYDSNFTICKTLYIFEENEKIISKEDSINTLISEIANIDVYYVIALAKKYLYIYNCTSNSLIRYFLNKLNDDNSKREGVNYNLIPYEINNIYIKFIISHLCDKDRPYKIYFFFMNFIFYKKKLFVKKKIIKRLIIGLLH